MKGVKFEGLIDAGDPLEQAKFYDAEGADELVFLDITASQEERRTMLDVVEGVASQIFLPFTVGGGVRTHSDIRDLLQSGADKVSINTAAVENPHLIEEGANRFGSQCIVLAIDARRVPGESRWIVCTHGGKTPTDRLALDWAREGEVRGAGEILLTSMDADGTQQGYDIELLAQVAEVTSLPLIASGGAGTLSHLCEAVVQGRADALLAASIFHYRQLTIAQVKEYLKKKGLSVRMDWNENRLAEQDLL